MSNENSRRLFYFLRRFTTLGGTSAYILFQTGVFTNSVGGTSINTIVFVLAGWASITFIRDYHKRATESENTNIGQLTRATSLSKMIPWIIVMVIAGAIQVGIANIFTHLVVISSLQMGGLVFAGYEMKYDLYIKRGLDKDGKLPTEVRL